ncbi:hypothetical protein SUGI_0648110 [Cryptomeria japonica]|nr:hypothetical protein SUGI_0648110 [Cryptomeria japonica]
MPTLNATQDSDEYKAPVAAEFDNNREKGNLRQAIGNKHGINNMKRGYSKVDEERAENSKSRDLVFALTSILVVAVSVSVGSNDNAHHHHHAWRTVSKVANSACSMASYPSYQTAKLHDLTNLVVVTTVVFEPFASSLGKRG